jgi:hypothetical protein
MTVLTSPRLEIFARLLARGYPPMFAARRAGFANFGHRRSTIRAALPGVVARVAELRAVAAGKSAKPAKPSPSSAPAEAPPPREPQDRELTEAEWVAEFAPMLRARAAGAAALSAAVG